MKRATGELPEMESSKAAAKKLAKHFKDGYSILDAGCGVGHYLRSYEKYIGKKNYSYTGIDATVRYVAIAKKIYHGRKMSDFSLGQ